MQLPLLVVLIIVFILGAVASGVAQFAVAKKRAEVTARARSLQKSFDRLVERNAERRRRLINRKELLDDYYNKDIEYQQGSLNYQALKQGIKEAESRIVKLEESITATESVITATERRLGELAIEKAQSHWGFIIPSIMLGGTTSLVFGFINYLGTDLDPVSSILDPVCSIKGSVFLSPSVIVQSIALGFGWPLVWAKFAQPENLEAKANAALARFEVDTKNAEKEEV